MTYSELLTELSVIEAFIVKLQDDDNNKEELIELQEQAQYLIDKISEYQEKQI